MILAPVPAVLAPVPAVLAPVPAVVVRVRLRRLSRLRFLRGFSNQRCRRDLNVCGRNLPWTTYTTVWNGWIIARILRATGTGTSVTCWLSVAWCGALAIRWTTLSCAIANGIFPKRNRWTLAHRRAIDVQTSTGLQVDLGCTFTGAFQCVFTVCTTIEGQRCVNQVVKGSWRGYDTMSAGVEGQLRTVAAVAQAIHVAFDIRRQFIAGVKTIARQAVHACKGTLPRAYTARSLTICVTTHVVNTGGTAKSHTASSSNNSATLSPKACSADILHHQAATYFSAAFTSEVVSRFLESKRFSNPIWALACIAIART